MENDLVLDAIFPSQTEYVESALVRASFFLNSLDEPDRDKGLLVLRELLLNAVVHGNRNNKDKKVHWSIAFLPQGGLEIAVEDEGRGFNYEKVEKLIPENPRSITKRGYMLIHALSSDVRFNQAGNQIRVFITSPPKT